MNAKHARPLAAFWLLAIAAAFITGTGLRASHSGAVVSPTQASSSRPPELVLGGVLEARTNQALLHPLAPDLWATGSAGGATATAVQVASPAAGGTQKARTGGTGGHDAKVQAHASTSTTHATATATSTATATGHGKGRGNGGGGRPTTTVTAAATPTGHAGGTGKGPSSDHGH